MTEENAIFQQNEECVKQKHQKGIEAGMSQREMGTDRTNAENITVTRTIKMKINALTEEKTC